METNEPFPALRLKVQRKPLTVGMSYRLLVTFSWRAYWGGMLHRVFLASELAETKVFVGAKDTALLQR